jgi:energy-coupling factor transporter ATP-binding protein EcfA2
VRSAEARKAWRHALEKERPFRLGRIVSRGKAPIPDFNVPLPNGLTVVCGLNGVGKTTLLRLIFGTLAGAEEEPGLREPLLDEGEFVVSIIERENEEEVALGSSAARKVVLIDAFQQCMHMLGLAAQPNFRDLAEGVEPYDFDPEQVRTAEYVVGKTYDEIRVAEIEDPDREDTVLPLFEVVSQGVTYGVQTMGLGELAALICLWQFWQIEAGTVVLVEEPETFLSSRATVALLDVLARRVHKGQLYAVVTTHSPGLAASVPLEAIRVLASGPALGLREPASRAELELLLGSHAGLARTILVEDLTAEVITGELIGRYKGIWGRSVEVRSVGGKDPLLMLCNTFPETERVRLVGVLDGDQDPPDNTRWPVFALPGPQNPDELLREAGLADLDRFSALVSRDIVDVSAAVEALKGVDPHDWFLDLAKELQVEPAALLRAALTCWLAQNDNEDLARELVERISVGLAT